VVWVLTRLFLMCLFFGTMVDPTPCACREQDFVQVLAMFAGFDFHWPPAIKAIFNSYSLVNFNFELLAPECSVSINFEAKW
jgi:hypothetical protein